MNDAGSITIWLQKLSDGDRDGVQQLWETYYHKLVKNARQRLRGLPQVHEHAEDVALSAFKSFCLAAEQNRFPKLDDRDDLWQILMMLMRNKAVNLREHHTRVKRDYRKVRDEAAMAAGDDSGDGTAFENMLRSHEPDPQFAVEVAEQLEKLLAVLDDEQLQEIAVLKMHGHTNVEIKKKIGRSLSLVERSLRYIRDCWGSALHADSGAM